MTNLAVDHPSAVAALQDAFSERVADEVRRRTATATDLWRTVSPTDTRSEKQITADAGAGAVACIGTAMTSVFGVGLGGGSALAALGAPDIASTITVGAGFVAFVYCLASGHRGLAPRLSRRFRKHRRIMADAVRVPAVAADAYATINEGAALLITLSAPDAAIEHVTHARGEAAADLAALGRLTDVDDNEVWLATTAPYQRLLTLAAEVTVLSNLSRDRLALPAGTAPPVPAGLIDAAEVGAYMLTENTHVAGVLNLTPATTS